MHMTYAYLEEKRIPHKKNGKLIVAVTPDEVGRLQTLFKNASTNGVPDIHYIDNPKSIQEVEPEVTNGLAAIHSPHTGIVDWGAVARSFADDITRQGGDILLNHRVTSFSESGDCVVMNTDHSSISAQRVLTCCGTYADRIAAQCGGAEAPQIVPIRGEYLRIPAGTLDIRGNIYPVPAPGVPFLGVHFTPLLSGDIILGPSAVPALSRDGYRTWDASLSDLRAMAGYAGFWRLLARHATFGVGELVRNAVPALAVQRAKLYVPRLELAHVSRAGVERAGVRAQAVSPAGDLVDDFVFERLGREGRIVHTRNAPSPGATSSMAISEYIADYLEASS
jgi:L-2-hydroxyglutarate oxidase LhgO